MLSESLDFKIKSSTSYKNIATDTVSCARQKLEFHREPLREVYPLWSCPASLQRVSSQSRKGRASQCLFLFTQLLHVYRTEIKHSGRECTGASQWGCSCFNAPTAFAVLFPSIYLHRPMLLIEIFPHWSSPTDFNRSRPKAYRWSLQEYQPGSGPKHWGEI